MKSLKPSTAIIIITAFTLAASVSAADNLARRLAGRILLQVESRGEAWYVNPADYRRYYLGRPKDAFVVMRDFGLGIKHNELREYLNNVFPERLAGKIMLDAEKNGEAYYVYPDNLKGYYLGRPRDAWNIMRGLSLGITDKNLNKIGVGFLNIKTGSDQNNNQNQNNETNGNGALYAAARAIRSGNTAKTLTYFAPELRKAVEYTMNFLDGEGRLTLGNILSGSKLVKSTANEKIYANKVYFGMGGYDVEIKFHVKKQKDGTWLIVNL